MRFVPLARAWDRGLSLGTMPRGAHVHRAALQRVTLCRLRLCIPAAGTRDERAKAALGGVGHAVRYIETNLHVCAVRVYTHA